MIYLRTTTKCKLLIFLITTFALTACNKPPTPSVMAAAPAPAGSASIRAMSATLSGASEVPPVSSSAGGTVEATFNTQSSMLAWTVSYSGMSGNVTGAHFHGPAAAGENAGVAVPVTGSTVSPIKGEAMLTAAQAVELSAGKWYFNLHTAAHPNGEIRGQVVAKP